MLAEQPGATKVPDLKNGETKATEKTENTY
jgi:hypothetical protein